MLQKIWKVLQIVTKINIWKFNIVSPLEKRVISLGHFSASFNNMLYGFFAVHLAPIFFPNVNSNTSIFLSFMVFASGFVARPIGAIYWGRWGDKYGRRDPLILTMFLISVPVMLIGFLPSYDSIGIFAPILLVVAKIIQGFLYGGEYVGVSLAVYESNNKTESGKNNSQIISMGFFGALFGTLFGALVVGESMPEWAWRIPFIVGGLSSGGILLFRKQIKETNDFVDHNQEKFINVYQKIKNNFGNFFGAIVLSGIPTVILYITLIFGNVMFQEAGMTQSQGMLVGTYILLISGIMILIFGKLADKFGHYRMLLTGVLLNILIGFLLFQMLSYKMNYFTIFIFVTLFSLFSALIGSCYIPYIFNRFKVRDRYSIVAVAVALGESLFGGVTPMLSMKLYGISHDITYVYYWVFAASILSLVSLMVLKDNELVKEKKYA